MTRLILNISQARNLQRQIGAWPNGWFTILATPVPDQPDTIVDPQREEAALAMMDMGCQDEQIAEQLGWRAPNLTTKPLRRLHKMLTRRTTR